MMVHRSCFVSWMCLFAISTQTFILNSRRCVAFRPAHPGRIISNLPKTSLKSSTESRQTEASVNGIPWQANKDCWRPDKQDVERISWGKPAKKKGTGSRGVPHRLNNDERELFEQARRHGFLQVVGSAWRSQRREAPLLNTHRSWCDARAQACLQLHKRTTEPTDLLCVDLSPLRVPQQFDTVAQACLAMQTGGQVYYDADLVEPHAEDGEEDEDDNPWDLLPIYRLPPFRIEWELPRAEAKQLGKTLAGHFGTIEKSVAKSKRPTGVKPGKGRRHGGYGIG